MISETKLKMLREQYKPGVKVRLIHMDDIQAPPVGAIGTVQHVDDAGSIHVSWRTGGGLALIPEVDEFEIVH